MWQWIVKILLSLYKLDHDGEIPIASFGVCTFSEPLKPSSYAHRLGLEEGFDHFVEVWVRSRRICPSNNVEVGIVYISVLKVVGPGQLDS